MTSLINNLYLNSYYDLKIKNDLKIKYLVYLYFYKLHLNIFIIFNIIKHICSIIYYAKIQRGMS